MDVGRGATAGLGACALSASHDLKALTALLRQRMSPPNADNGTQMHDQRAPSAVRSTCVYHKFLSLPGS
jgi:hypothetical protein